MWFPATLIVLLLLALPGAILLAVHLFGQYLIYLLVLLHVVAALYHAMIRRDAVLDHMLPRRRLG